MRAPLRIDLYVHGRGLGHASRMAPVLGRLRDRGHDVRALGAQAVLDRLGESTAQVRAHVGRGPRAPGEILRRARVDLADMDRRRPDVVVSDGDAPSILAAALRGTPRVAVGHGLLFVAAPLPGLPGAPRLVEGLNALSAGALANRWVVAHFAFAASPLPHVDFVRTDVTAGLDRSAPPTGPVLAYFRDAVDGGVVDALRHRGVPVDVAGHAGAPCPPHEFRARLERARGVVGTAGSNLCAEAAHLGIPFLALARRGDHEQRLNAAIVEREGLGVAGDLDALDAGPVTRFVERLTGVRSAPRVGPTASVADAVERAIDTVLHAR